MMNKYTLVLMGAAIIAVGGWLTSSKQNSENSQQQVTDNKTPLDMVISIDADEFDRLAQDEGAFVLDVHIPEQTHIPGTDTFVPYNEINKNKDKLPTDKDTPILVYCRSGSMSPEASKELVKLGYNKVYDLIGGINAYKHERSTILISPELQDLETVVYGDVAETKFILTNFTQNPLKITRVSTSCGCTSASVEKKELKPYEETTVNASFDPAVHKDDTDLGDVTRTIYINTDNPNFEQLIANITATVIKREEVEQET